MERWQNCVAVVTGASSGIGEAVAKDLVKAGLRVVALGRRQERLDQNRASLSIEEQARFYAKRCDVSNEAEVKATFDWIEKTLGGIDVLVNNAGIVREGNLVEMDTKLIQEILNTNVNGVIYCTQAAFKSMKARNFDGHIVNINSLAGHKVMSLDDSSSNIYPSSKFAVTAINETIRNELRNFGTKIKATSISPGAVRTEMCTAETWDKIKNILSPGDVSQAILFALSTPPHVRIHELIIKAVGEIF